jgi:uncharacterized membrane protein YfcA
MARMPAFALPVELPALLFLAAVYLGGAVINGLVGFGLALVAVNALATVLNPKAGVIVMSLIAPLMSGYQLRHNWSLLEGWGRLRSLLAWAILGSLIGIVLLVSLPTWAIAIALGLFTVQFTIDRMRRERPAMAEHRERRLAPVAGLVGGITNSALGASGPIFGSYLFAIGLRGKEFAFGISVVFFVMALVRLTSLAVAGQYTLPLVQLAFICFFPAIVGQHLGQTYQGRVDPRMFQRVLLAVLLVSSVNMLIQGVTAMLRAFGVAI